MNWRAYALQKWIINYALLLHLMWGITLISATHPLRTTPLSGPAWLLGNPPQTVLGLAYIAVALLAFSGLWRDSAHRWWPVVSLLPQEVFLLVSATGSLHAVLVGHYADLEPRPAAFIFTDQLPNMLAAVMHTAAMVEVYYANYPRISLKNMRTGRD